MALPTTPSPFTPPPVRKPLMDRRLLALLEPPKVGTLRGFLRSYLTGTPTGRHSRTLDGSLSRTSTRPFAMPDSIRYRVRAAILRPKRETYWDGSTPSFSTPCFNAQCPVHFPKEEDTNERPGLPTPEDTPDPA